jgi:hypothetical protein
MSHSLHNAMKACTNTTDCAAVDTSAKRPLQGMLAAAVLSTCCMLYGSTAA